MAAASLASGAGAAKTKVLPEEEVVDISLHAAKSEFAHVLYVRLFPLQGVATVSTLRNDFPLEDDSAVSYALAIPKGPFGGSVHLEVPGLGEIVGQVAAKKPPRGAAAPKGCSAPPEAFTAGTFEGTIDIKGAGDLGRWKATEAEAHLERYPQRRCKPGTDRGSRRPDNLFSYFSEAGPALPGPDDYWLEAHHVTFHRETVWDAMGRGGRVFLAAIDFEWLPGKIAAERWVTQDGMPVEKSLIAGPGRPHPASAVVHGTAPIFGTARYSRRGKRLSGSLRARFPGLTLPLTGRGWKASFYDYDVER